MTMRLTLVMLTAWLISHQMANSSASVVNTLTILCIVLVTGLLCKWMCEMDVAT